LFVALAGCGRLGFDALGADASGSGGHDGSGAQQMLPVAGAKIWLQMETEPKLGIVDSAGGHTCSCDTMTGCPTRVAGLHASGYEFSGQDIQVADDADLDLSAGFTAAAWIRVDGYPTSNLAALFAKPFGPSDDTFVLAVGSDMHATFDFEDANATTSMFGGPVLPVGTWHHLAFVGTGSQTSGYVDGVFAGSVNAAGGLDKTSPFFVGGDDIPASFFLAGTVDDVVLYTRVLDAAELAQLATP
jgi:hypothetical protein